LFQGFIHSGLLWGTLLAGVPLLIHLFNRQRHKPMRWAAMRFVQAAYRRTRRRAQLENLLLLLLRMAAVALLALAIARPFVGDDSALGAVTEKRRDLVLVIDTSASSDYRMDIQSVFEASLERAGKILDELDGSRGDRVRLYTAGARPRLLSARSPEDAVGVLATLERPSDEVLDLAQLVAELVQYAEEDAAGTEHSAIEVRLLTDMQQNSFQPHTAARTSSDAVGLESAAGSSLIAGLERLGELGVRIVVEDLGPGALTPHNLGVESVLVEGEVQGAGLPNEVSVRVRNFGDKPKSQVRVALKVDGVKQQVIKLDLEARGADDASFRVVFKSAGAHTLEASLEGDRLAVDDRRATVVQVPAPIRVLLVNGDPREAIDRDEVGYLRAVLDPVLDDDSPRMGDFSPFQTRVLPALSFGFGELDLGDYDLIVLANVGSISKRMVSELEKRVARGAALFITLGDRTADRSALDALNKRLYNVDGTGLLPAKLFRKRTASGDAYYRCSEFDETHPALKFFADERWRPFLTEVPFYAFIATEDYSRSRVLAAFDDEEHHPLLLERDFNRGKVLLWTSTIDTDWNRVGESPSTLIPLVHELFRYATRASGEERNLAVGEALSMELDSFPRSPSLVAPDGSRRPLDGAPKQILEDRYRLPEIHDLDQTGIWHVEWERQSQPFSVEMDPAEGDLARISGPDLEAQSSTWQMAGGESQAGAASEDPSRGELWRLLAGLALAMLVGETLWSAWLGRKRRLA